MTITVLEFERRCRGLSATELARRMGVSKSTVSAVERRRRPPSVVFLAKAASVLNLRATDLWPEARSVAIVHDTEGTTS